MSSPSLKIVSEMDYGGDAFSPSGLHLPNFHTMAGAQKRATRRKRTQRGGVSDPSRQNVVPRAPSTLTITRMHNLGTLSPAVTDYGYSLVANLNVMPNLTEITGFFQEYRIKNAVYDITFIPASPERYSTTVWYANYVKDTSGSLPASLNDVAQASGVKRFSFGPDKRLLRVGFSPRIRTSDTVYMLRTSPWITTQTPNVSHGGLWLWFEDFNSTESLGARIRLTVTLTLQLRGTV